MASFSTATDYTFYSHKSVLAIKSVANNTKSLKV